MVKSLYFTNRKQYYLNKSEGKATNYKEFVIFKKVIYFVNFEIADTNAYVVGSLTSPKKIPLSTAITLIQNAIPSEYLAVNFYEAQEEGEVKSTYLSLIRDGETFIEERINV